MLMPALYQADKSRDGTKRVEKAEKSAVDYAKSEADRLDRASRDAAKDVNAKIDNIDKSVEKKASEAKGGISSWFGGGGKKD